MRVSEAIERLKACDQDAELVCTAIGTDGDVYELSVDEFEAGFTSMHDYGAFDFSETRSLSRTTKAVLVRAQRSTGDDDE